MIRRTLSSLRWYVLNMWHWQRQRGRRKLSEGPRVHFDLLENRWHRYLHILVLFLHEQGYLISFRHRWGFIGSWASNDLFRRSAFFRITFRDGRPNERWLITDRPGPGERNILTADYFTVPPGPAGFRVPMPMVDSQYITGTLHRLPPKPGTRRRRALFFFGNMDEASYADDRPSRLFGCLRRTELLDLVRKNFAHRIHAPAALHELLTPHERDIVLMDRRKAYIAPQNLPDVLVQFDLFLAPSGVVMPLCHNLIEAMFAGCIPVLQHPHLLDPPLRNGIECLAFSNEQELNQLIERFPDMDALEVEGMRRAVLDYCRLHLTPAAVVARLEQARAQASPIHLNGEVNSVQLLEDSLRGTPVRGTMAMSVDR